MNPGGELQAEVARLEARLSSMEVELGVFAARASEAECSVTAAMAVGNSKVCKRRSLENFRMMTVSVVKVRKEL
jgi:hypothetical protein